jgi:branched-chain amino acid transport system ATP-binding protein
VIPVCATSISVRAIMADLLRVRQVTAGYQDTVVLEDVSLHVAEQEPIALLGRNGVGKTTLLATLMGLTMMRAGHILLGGQDITDADIHRRAPLGLGYVPQGREIFPSLSVEENLRVARRPGEWSVARVQDLFPRLAERRRHLGNQLSGGEQQMLAIARALVGNPRLLLLDEPLEGLAPILVDSVAEALARLRKESGMAMILVEQQIDVALELTDRAIILDKGQIVWESRSNDLARDPERVARLIGIDDVTTGQLGASR